MVLNRRLKNAERPLSMTQTDADPHGEQARKDLRPAFPEYRSSFRCPMQLFRNSQLRNRSRQSVVSRDAFPRRKSTPRAGGYAPSRVAVPAALLPPLQCAGGALLCRTWSRRLFFQSCGRPLHSISTPTSQRGLLRFCGSSRSTPFGVQNVQSRGMRPLSYWRRSRPRGLCAFRMKNIKKFVQ